MTNPAEMTPHAKMLALADGLCNKLSASDRSFFQSVRESTLKWGWTEGRERVMGELYARAVTPAPTITDVDNILGIVDLFKTAGAVLKHPAITIKPLGLSYAIRLSLSGPTSRIPGSITICGTARSYDGRRPYYGRITPQGKWEPARAVVVKGEADVLGAFLMTFAANPARMASAWGKKTGHCCFCNRPLTDKRSTEAGFGETCAKHWGLHSRWLVAHKNALEELVAA